MLELVDGPECPACGCRDGRIIRHPQPDGATWFAGGLARCNHCGMEFHFKEASDKKVPFPPRLKCPKCGGQDVPVTSTRKNMRNHRCRDCAHTFQSIEKR